MHNKTENKIRSDISIHGGISSLCTQNELSSTYRKKEADDTDWKVQTQWLSEEKHTQSWASAGKKSISKELRR